VLRLTIFAMEKQKCLLYVSLSYMSTWTT